MRRDFVRVMGPAIVVALAGAMPAMADVSVTVDPAAPWIGFMNVSELPSNGGGYVFGSPWAPADLAAVFTGPVLRLAPNSVNDTSPFWYTPMGGPGSSGNKIMDANMYQEVTGPFSGTTVTFSGIVLSNTLTAAHTSVAFIKDFAPDYSSSVTVTVPLTPGPFSVSLATIADPARHVQFGFETIGVNVWITDVEPYGNVQVTAIPAPAGGLALLGLGGLLARRRR